jgi:hypothetical protein
VANSTTGRWARYTGWEAHRSVVHDDRMFFGTGTGTVFEAEVTGSDDGAPYYGVVVPKFSTCGTSDEKAALHARAMTRQQGTFFFRLLGLDDFAIPEMSTPAVAPNESAHVWGTGVWGTAIWGGEDMRHVTTEWEAVYGTGFSLGLAFMVGTGSVARPHFELLMLELLYEAGLPL